MSRLYAITFGTAGVISLVIIVVSIATVSWVFVDENVNGLNQTRRQIGLFSQCIEGECEPISKLLGSHFISLTIHDLVGDKAAVKNVEVITCCSPPKMVRKYFWNNTSFICFSSQATS